MEILPGPVPAYVLRVVDGDTLMVRARIWPGHHVETLVRLKGVDAPELKARCAKERALANEARDFLEQRAAGLPVWLSDIHFGKYAGRVLARVAVDSGTDLGAQLLAVGLARTYVKGPRLSWCEGMHSTRARP
ncbi:MAG: thermonuclease family protein [Alphaproteobacteria bacterium]